MRRHAGCRTIDDHATMDNLTHGLAGAVLGQMGLKRKTGLAMPTLIIGANIPDIDAVATLLGTQQLALRRGVTHGPVALLVLPLLLWGAMLAWDRWRSRRLAKPGRAAGSARVPVHAGWLLALACIGTLSHPLLDWMNSYGIRLLAPFSSEWFAANTLFIIDLWLWLALIAGVWMSRRRERRGHAGWRSPALACGAAVVAYIAANGLITQRAQALTRAHVHAEHARTPTLVVANPVPVAFWQRELLWRDATHHGDGAYSVIEALRGPGDGARLTGAPKPHHMDDPRVALAREASADARAFLFWSRMPLAAFGDDGSVMFTDQRFTRAITRGTFTLVVPPREGRALAP
jgi:inner membrane protein